MEETGLAGSRGYAAHEVMSPEFSRTDESNRCATSRRHTETAEQQLTDWAGGRAWRARTHGQKTCAPGLAEPRAEDVPGEHGDARRIRTRAGARRTKGWGRARGARRLRAGLCAPAGARRTKGWGRARIARQSRTESVHTPGPSRQRAEDTPGSTSSGVAHRTTK